MSRALVEGASALAAPDVANEVASVGLTSEELVPVVLHGRVTAPLSVRKRMHHWEWITQILEIDGAFAVFRRAAVEAIKTYTEERMSVDARALASLSQPEFLAVGLNGTVGHKDNSSAAVLALVRAACDDKLDADVALAAVDCIIGDERMELHDACDVVSEYLVCVRWMIVDVQPDWGRHAKSRGGGGKRLRHDPKSWAGQIVGEYDVDKDQAGAWSPRLCRDAQV